MTEFLLFVAFILITLIWARMRRLEKRISWLEDERIPAPAPVTRKEEPRAEKPALRETAAEKAGLAPISHEPATAPQAPGGEAAPGRATGRILPPRNELLRGFEKQFAENWTGIVGAIVLVMGVSFLAIYAALTLSAFVRFLLITAASGGLYAVYFAFRNSPRLGRFALWVRSAAGALFLFGCLGSSEIPGIKWIDDSRAALGLLGAGVLANIWCGFAGRSQATASLHVVLCLVSLGVAPQSPLTLGITGLVALTGVAFAYRERWEYHLLATITGFLAYHIYWYYAVGAPAAVVETRLIASLQWTGISVTAIIGVAACLVHYRDRYRTEGFDPVPFLAHLGNWIYMLVGYLMYSSGSKWNTLVLAGASLAAFLLARRAKAIPVRWLETTDTLVGQALAVAAILTLRRWGWDWLPVCAALYFQSLFFIVYMAKEGTRLLERAGIFLHYAAALLLVVVALDEVRPEEGAHVITSALILAGALLGESALHLATLRGMGKGLDAVPVRPGAPDGYVFAPGGVLMGLFLCALYAILQPYPWAPWALSAAGCGFIVMRHFTGSAGLWAGMLFFAVVAHMIAWAKIALLRADPAAAALYGAPLLALDVMLAVLPHRWGGGKPLVWPGIYLMAVHLAVVGYYATVDVSALIPGVLWLLTSVGYREAASWAGRRTGPAHAGALAHLVNAGALFLALFLARHVLVHMQSEMYIGPVRVRLLIELFALAVFLYWALWGLPRIKDEPPGWKFGELAWELFLGFLAFTIALEVPVVWHPPAWALLAAALFLAGADARVSRMRFYSLPFYWASAIHVAFVSSSHVTPSLVWTDQAWVGGVCAMAVQVGYIVLFYLRGGIAGIAFPYPVRRIAALAGAVERRRNLWVYYPVFVSAALFLYWTFDSSVLTLLWVAETFAIFVLALFLREGHFRLVSMLGLAGCLVRLVFFDLAQSGTLARALVFVGVGAIMLFMNMLYGKYRDRF